jgi:hypothetical protein
MLNNFFDYPSFDCGQIVAIDNTNSVLYGEIIQTIPQRQMCWVRVLAIAQLSPQSSKAQYTQASLYQDSDGVIINLHGAIDLLFPLNLFRVALDSEIMPLLSKINPYEPHDLLDSPNSRQRLNQFLQEIWQNNPDKFLP